MRLIPVIDVRGGQAVQARSGDRKHYRPISSILHPGSDPRSLARALRDRVGHPDLYLADLDAIEGCAGNRDLLAEIVAQGALVHVDPGIRQAEDVAAWLDAGAARVALALETLAGPEVLRSAVDRFGAHRLAFGLDLRAGRPILAPGAEPAWGSAATSPHALLELAHEAGMTATIAIELARVGLGQGLADWAVPLGRHAQSNLPGLELWVGGGLADAAELPLLAAAGIAGALVATALHGNRLGPATAPPGHG